MDDHEQLIEEAEKLAKGMKQGEKIEQGFIYAYVANAELRALWQELKHLRWILSSVLVVLALGVLANLLT